MGHIGLYILAIVIGTINIVLALVGLAVLPEDLQKIREEQLAMLDECGSRIALGLVGVVVLVGTHYFVEFRKRRIARKKEKAAREHHKRLLDFEASDLVDRYIWSAIEDKKAYVRMAIRQGILNAFIKASPEDVEEIGRGQRIYDGFALEQWIRVSAIKMLVAHWGELGAVDSGGT